MLCECSGWLGTFPQTFALWLTLFFFFELFSDLALVVVVVVVVGCVVLDRARGWSLHVVRLVDVGGGDASVGLGLHILVLLAQR